MAGYAMCKKTAAEKKLTVKERGYSLIELLFTLILLSILLSLSFPAYKYIMVETRLMTLSESIVSAFNYARSEAIKHRSIVIFCPVENEKNCGAKWNNGWMIILGKRTANISKNNLLHVYPPLNKQEFIIWRGASKRNYLQLNPDGSAYGHNGSFVVCVNVLSKSSVWVVKVSATGRIRVDKDAGLHINCHDQL